MTERQLLNKLTSDKIFNVVLPHISGHPVCASIIPEEDIVRIWRIASTALCDHCHSRLRLPSDHVCGKCIEEAKK